MSANSSDDFDLLARAQQGDADAFGELCRELEPRLWRQAMALCGQVDLAEELAQETLIEAWKSVRRYRGRSSMFTWLCAILFHRYLNARRRKRPLPFSSMSPGEAGELDDHLNVLTDPGSGPAQAVEQSERRLLLQRCIETLPEKHQHVVYLRFYVDESLESIAAALDCSVGTIKSRLFYSLEKLRLMPELTALWTEAPDFQS